MKYCKLFAITLITSLLLVPEVQATPPDLSSVLDKAIAYGQQDKYKEASESMEAAIKDQNLKLLNKNNPQTATYLRFLTYFYLQQSRYSEALNALNKLLRSPDYEIYSLNKQLNIVNRDRLFQWSLLMHDKDEQEANRILRLLLKEAKIRNQICNTEFAEFLLGAITKENLIKLNNQRASKCRFLGESSEALVYFWIAKKYDFEGKTEEAKLFFKLFLNNSSQEDILERGLAFKYLKIPSEDRHKYIEKQSDMSGHQCLCTMSKD